MKRKMWSESEQQYMLELVKEYSAEKVNNKGIVYVPHKARKTRIVANEVNNVYGNGRSNHGVRKRVQKLQLTHDQFLRRVGALQPSIQPNKEEKKECNLSTLEKIYGVVTFKEFIKIQSSL